MHHLPTVTDCGRCVELVPRDRQSKIGNVVLRPSTGNWAITEQLQLAIRYLTLGVGWSHKCSHLMS